jgi:hypothetical protein
MPRTRMKNAMRILEEFAFFMVWLLLAAVLYPLIIICTIIRFVYVEPRRYIRGKMNEDND